MKHTIICGHVLDVLKTLPNESIDCVVTSPPYWGGLRDYGESTYTIWNGNPSCEHEWEDCSRKFSKPHHGISSNIIDIATVTKDAEHKSFSSGKFCKRCGAFYGQLGLEPSLEMYINHLLDIMKELKRVLKKTGVIFWNQGDSYASSSNVRTGGMGWNSFKYREHQGRCVTNEIPPKSLCLQNERFIARCVDELGLRLRDRIIWAKKIWISKTNTTIGSAMPTSANDRCAFTYEPVYVLVKSPRYYWDQDAIRTPLKEATRERVRHAFNPTKGDIQGAMKHTGARHFAERVNQGDLTGANRPNVWQINLEPSSLPHWAAFPRSLVSSCLLAGCPPNGVVMDIFAGTGTVGVVAEQTGFNSIQIDSNEEYCEMAYQRLKPLVAQTKLGEEPSVIERIGF